MPSGSSATTFAPATSWGALAPTMPSVSPSLFYGNCPMPQQGVTRGWPYRPAAQPVVPPSGTITETRGVALKPVGRLQAEQWKNAGNELRKQRQYREAAHAYASAIQTDPTYTDAYFNDAQLMVIMGNIPRGIERLWQLLKVDPADHDARVVLGEYYEKQGNTQEAKKRYMEVLQAAPDFDPARRRLNYLLYLDQRRFYPETADQLMQTQYREVIHKARELLKTFYTQYYPNPVTLRLSQTVPIVFDTTTTLDDTANVAEYDAQKNAIRLQPQMMFSTPNVVGAYLAHELSAHAVDEDNQSSVREEQQGYRRLAQFWDIYQGAENDPNLDRALDLHRQGYGVLDQEVRRVYTIREPGIPETSPGHGQPSTNATGKLAQAYETSVANLTPAQVRLILSLKPKTTAS